MKVYIFIIYYYNINIYISVYNNVFMEIVIHIFNAYDMLSIIKYYFINYSQIRNISQIRNYIKICEVIQIMLKIIINIILECNNMIF